MKQRWIPLDVVAVAIAAFLVQSCNLAQLFGLKASPPLQEYSVLASNNSSLSQDATGLIKGTGIYLMLPYGPVANGTQLTPTVKLPGGYSISPSGSYWVHDGMTLTVTETSNDTTTSYYLHVSEIPSTTPSPGPASAIASFNFTAAANAGVLTADADGVVYGTNVYVTLPYVVVSEMQSGAVKLSSTVALQSGYTLTSPPAGTRYAYTDGMTLDVTDSTTNQSYNYILHISATPNSQFSGSSSLVQSFAVTHALNPLIIPTDCVGVINGTNIYLTLPLSVVMSGTQLTPSVTLQSGYTISLPSGSSYELTDGMTLVITQTSSGAFTDYTLHVGTSAASMAFLQLASPFYYDASGVKQPLSASEYTLSFASATNTYTLTLNTDAFANEMPYMAAYVESVVAGRPIGFATVATPYNATVMGSSAAIGGAVAPYTITVKSSDGTVANTYTVDVVRTQSSWIGVSSASANVENAYTYTDTTHIDSGWYLRWLSSGYLCTNNQTAFFNGGSCYVASGFGTTYYFNGNGGNSLYAPTGTYATGKAVANPSAVNMGTSLTLSASTSLEPALAGGQIGTTTASATIRNGGSETVVTGCGAGCTTTNSYGETWTGGGTATLDIDRTYSPAGYVVPTTFTVNIPLAITINAVNLLTGAASYTTTAGSTDMAITITMDSTTGRVSGSVASIQCTAESGTTQTLYVVVQ